MPGLSYADDLVLHGKSKQELTVKEGHFVEVCRRRGLKVNVDKSKLMVLGEEEKLECEICVDGAQLEQMSVFKYLGCFG